MISNPKVSVIVPIYNVEPYLARCLESVRNQTLQDIEIVLVDDGSPDNCPALCDAYAQKEERIKVVHKQNAGLGMARNSGLDVATGEFVAFVDSDDVIEPTMYADLYELVQRENADVALSNTIFDNNGKLTYRYDVSETKVFRGRSVVDGFLLDYVAPAPECNRDVKYMMSVWRGIYRRSLLEEKNIRFLSEREVVSEDIPFNIDFFSVSDCVVYSNKAYYHYCANGASLTQQVSRAKCERFGSLQSVVYQKLEKLFPIDKFILRYQRMLLLELRSILISELRMSRVTEDDFSDRLDYWVEKESYNEVLSSYPFGHMPIKFRVFFWLVRNRCVSLLKFLCK